VGEQGVDLGAPLARQEVGALDLHVRRAQAGGEAAARGAGGEQVVAAV
jgi:hypothetical protein